MPSFSVNTDWFGFVPGPNLLLFQSLNYEKFLATKAVYDLDVTASRVELTGPVAARIESDQKLVVTEKPISLFGLTFYAVSFSLSEVCSRFQGRADGWRPRSLKCLGDRAAPDTGEPQPAPAGDGFAPIQEATGIELRFKGTINAGTIQSTQPAPTITAALKGQSVTIPIGETKVQTTGGANHDNLSKYRLCPDGSSSFTATLVEQGIADDTVFGVQGLKARTTTTINPN